MHHRHKQQGGLQGAGEDEGGGASRSGSTRALRQAVSAVAGEQAQGDRKGEEEEGVTSPSASSGKTDKRGTSCLNCRTSKVKCDKALPSCSRCIRRAEKCEYRLGELSGHGEARGGAQGEVPPSIIRQTIIDPPALFKAQAELLAAAVKQLHRDGGISRIRAINTLRIWRMENELRDGFDTTWGALKAIMATLDISDSDLDSAAAEDEIEFPTLGGLPRARLSPAWETLDITGTRMWQNMEPTVPTMVLGALKLMRVNESAEELVFLPEEVNRALEEEKCLAAYLSPMHIMQSDQVDFMQAAAAHLFGQELAVMSFVMVVGKDGRATLRILRLRHTPFSELGVVCSVVTLEEAPSSRYTTGMPKTRDRVIESFRNTTSPPSSPPSAPSPPSASPTSASQRRTVARSGASAADAPDLEEESSQDVVLPMTSMGQMVDPARARELLAAETRNPQSVVALLQRTASSLSSSASAMSVCSTSSADTAGSGADDTGHARSKRGKSGGGSRRRTRAQQEDEDDEEEDEDEELDEDDEEEEEEEEEDHEEEQQEEEGEDDDDDEEEMEEEAEEEQVGNVMEEEVEEDAAGDEGEDDATVDASEEVEGGEAGGGGDSAGGHE